MKYNFPINNEYKFNNRKYNDCGIEFYCKRK